MKEDMVPPHHDDYNLNLHNVNENTFIKWLLYARVVYTNNKAEQKSLKLILICRHVHFPFVKVFALSVQCKVM